MPVPGIKPLFLGLPPPTHFWLPCVHWVHKNTVIKKKNMAGGCCIPLVYKKRACTEGLDRSRTMLVYFSDIPHTIRQDSAGLANHSHSASKQDRHAQVQQQRTRVMFGGRAAILPLLPFHCQKTSFKIGLKNRIRPPFSCKP